MVSMIPEKMFERLSWSARPTTTERIAEVVMMAPMSTCGKAYFTARRPTAMSARARSRSLMMGASGA